MFIMDMPYIPAQTGPVVLLQVATNRPSTQADFILNDCMETHPTPDDPTSAWRGVDPAYMLKNYIQAEEQTTVNLADIKTTLLQGTNHGKLLTSTSNYGRTTYHYDPESGFIGTDKAVFMADFAGKRYKINVEIKVLIVVDERQSQCDRPDMIKVPNGQAYFKL